MTGLAKGAWWATCGAALAGCMLAAAQPARAPDDGGAAGAAGAALPAVAPRNVLLIVIDTLRQDHLGCYGYGRPTSPHLDAFAAAGARFQHCLAASSWTEPSTASLLSGLHAARHGAHEYSVLPDELELISERLAAAGWRTLAVSGNPNASPQFRFDQGFDQFWFDDSDKAREYPDVSELVAHAEALLAQDDGRPTFCWLHVMNVHGPYVAPEAFRDRFRRPGSRDFPFQSEVWKEVMRKGEVARRADVTPADVQDLEDRYDAAIAWTDDVLGRFLARRRATTAGQNELVVITADHGEELFDHGGFGHGFTLHREVVDVPLLLCGPGIAPARVAAPVGLVDVAATLLELAGQLPSVGGAGGRFGDGQSLVPLLTGGEFERDLPLVAQLERERQGQAFLLQSWPSRLIETRVDYAGRRDVAELFDRVADPAERRDLLLAEPERSTRLRALLAARRAALEAQGMAAQRAALDPEQQRQMEALGYGGP
ncbi:MAG: sulfatase [Planctomycetes bacterium]|nr:sulfatase [Planctomycetota bacterium]